MKLLFNSNIKFSTIVFFFIGCSLAVYFIFVAIQGNYGHFKHKQIQVEKNELKKHLAELKSIRKSLENKTKRLSNNYLDLDLLDELARKILAMARTDEIIID